MILPFWISSFYLIILFVFFDNPQQLRFFGSHRQTDLFIEAFSFLRLNVFVKMPMLFDFEEVVKNGEYILNELIEVGWFFYGFYICKDIFCICCLQYIIDEVDYNCLSLYLLVLKRIEMIYFFIIIGWFCWDFFLQWDPDTRISKQTLGLGNFCVDNITLVSIRYFWRLFQLIEVVTFIHDWDYEVKGINRYQNMRHYLPTQPQPDFLFGLLGLFD